MVALQSCKQALPLFDRYPHGIAREAILRYGFREALFFGSAQKPGSKSAPLSENNPGLWAEPFIGPAASEGLREPQLKGVALEGRGKLNHLVTATHKL